MYIFIDESGDLGHKDLDNPAKSKYFILVGLCCGNPKKVAKCVVKTKDTIKRRKELHELKFTSSKPDTRRRLLEKLSKVDIDVHAIVVDKTTVFPSLMDKKEIYFNWVSGYLVRRLILYFPDDKKVNIIVDRRSFSENQNEFNDYIRYKIKTVLGKGKWDLDIQHKDSKRELCLQATDFIAGAIHQKYRYNKISLFEIIKHKVNIEEMHRQIK